MTQEEDKQTIMTPRIILNKSLKDFHNWLDETKPIEKKRGEIVKHTIREEDGTSENGEDRNSYRIKEHKIEEIDDSIIETVTISTYYKHTSSDGKSVDIKVHNDIKVNESPKKH